MLAGPQSVDRIVRASAVIIEQSNAAKRNSIDTFARRRKNAVIAEHASSLGLDLKSFLACAQLPLRDLFFNKHRFLYSDGIAGK